jgi:hypothetical protein
MQVREFEMQLQREVDQERALTAADYGPIEERERLIAATAMSDTSRAVLDEGIAVIRGEVDAGREEGDRKIVAEGLAYLAEVDEFLADLAAGRSRNWSVEKARDGLEGLASSA